jgi:hypothetical protein
MIALGRDEEDTCACAFEVQGTIEVHLPVLQLLRRRRLLGLRPLGDEIGEDLGFDGLPWAKFLVEFTQLDRPLDDAPHSVVAAQDFSEGEAGNDLDLVRLEVMAQLADVTRIAYRSFLGCENLTLLSDKTSLT